MPIDQIIHCKLYNVSNCKPFFQRKKTILCCVETTKREKKWNIVGLLQTNQVLFTALCLELPGNVTPSYGTYFKNYCYLDIGTLAILFRWIKISLKDSTVFVYVNEGCFI